MTDEELIARLLGWARDIQTGSTAIWAMDQDLKAAANRIEQLVVTNEDLIAERDHWKDVAGREGVCMTCSGPYGAPEPYGCSDCFNTGHCGEYHNTVADLEAKLAKAVEALRFYAWENEMRLPSDGPWGARSTDFGKVARAALAEISSEAALNKGESHE